MEAFYFSDKEMAARVKSISATPIHTVPELDGFIKAFKLFNFQGDGHRKHPGHHGAAGNEDVRKCRTHHEGSGEKGRALHQSEHEGRRGGHGLLSGVSHELRHHPR